MRNVDKTRLVRQQHQQPYGTHQFALPRSVIRSARSCRSVFSQVLLYALRYERHGSSAIAELAETLFNLGVPEEMRSVSSSQLPAILLPLIEFSLIVSRETTTRIIQEFPSSDRTGPNTLPDHPTLDFESCCFYSGVVGASADTVCRLRHSWSIKRTFRAKTGSGILQEALRYCAGMHMLV